MICKKVYYRTEHEALEALHTIRAIGVKRAYQCLHCGMWHLTSKELKTRKVKERHTNTFKYNHNGKIIDIQY